MSSLETMWEHTWPWPIWTAVLGIALLLAAAVRLYYYEVQNRSRPTQLVLVGCRITVCLLLVWMLGGWQLQQHRTEPAELVIAVDDSASMSFADEYESNRARSWLRSFSLDGGTGSAGRAPSRFEIARQLLVHPRTGWLSHLRDRYQIRLVRISESAEEFSGDEIRTAWQDRQAAGKSSRLGEGLRELLKQQEGNPTVAVLLLTDGVTTSGLSLSAAAEASRRQGVPLYLIGLGNERRPRDLRLVDLIADDVAFAGDVVPIDVQLLADGLKGQKAVVRLQRTDTGEQLAEETIAVDQAPSRIPVRLNFRPQVAGTIPLEIRVLPATGEADTSNNQLLHELHVNDATLKVLLVQAYPSYEYRYLKNLLSRATRASDPSLKAFDLTTVLQEADPEHAEQDPTAARVFPLTREELLDYDVVVFGDVDPRLLGRVAMENLNTFVAEHGRGIVFIAGPRFVPQAYSGTALAELLPFLVSNVGTIDEPPYSQPFQTRLTNVGALAPVCQLESSRARNLAAWRSLPELYWFVPIQSHQPGVRVLLEHATRTNEGGTPLPLVTHHFVGRGRVVFHATDETYRWARFQEGEEYYSRYWLQTLRSLSRSRLLAGESGAEISVDRQQYLPGDEVQLRVRFREENADVESATVVLEEKNGLRRDVVLSRTDSALGTFAGSVRDLPPGSYRAWLSAPLLDPPPAPRTLTVSGDAQELVGVPLNAAEMKQAAANSGGRYYDWYDASDVLRDLPRGQRLRIESLPPEPAWNTPWVAGLLIAVLTAEWLLRKRVGLA